MEKSLVDSKEFWLNRTAEEINNFLGSSVSAMVGFDQRNPHHCYDLFTHSIYTVEGISNTAPALLRVAAFFHDIGKPSVAMEKQGRLVFYGHARKSAEIAPPILEKIGYTQDEIKEICFYIRHHDDFISWVLPEEEYNRENKFFVEITTDNLCRHMEKVRRKNNEDDYQPDIQSWRDLLVLCHADASAQAEVVVQNGVVIDTKEHKLKKISALQKCLESFITH
jgi:putative nucleotidyltransferase with HDIG domain